MQISIVAALVFSACMASASVVPVVKVIKRDYYPAPAPSCKPMTATTTLTRVIPGPTVTITDFSTVTTTDVELKTTTCTVTDTVTTTCTDTITDYKTTTSTYFVTIPCSKAGY
jgi:hypothetical protein